MHPDLEQIQSGDIQLQSRVARALQIHDPEQSLAIDACATCGCVTLIGAVPNESERRVCCECVRRVPGVHRVKNRLAIVRAVPHHTRFQPERAVMDNKQLH
jgi:osmotically-inducible protein OsmY